MRVAVVLSLVVAAVCAGEQGLFGSAGVLRSFLQENNLADHHVGVGFDVVRGTPSNVRLFGPSPAVDVDVLSAKARYDVRRLVHARDVHEFGARELHTEHLPGMLVRWQGSPVAYPPPRPAGATAFLATRSEVLVVVKLKVARGRLACEISCFHSLFAPQSDAKSHLEPSFKAALATMPEDYSPEDDARWTTFFTVFPMYYADTALVGGKIVVSASSTDLDEEVVKGLLDRALHSGHPLNATLLGYVRDRVTVLGGDSTLLEGSLRSFSTDKHARWVESVRQRPTVIGHHVRPISDLVAGNGRKKVAVELAIEAHLEKSYQVWRKEQTRHNRDVQMLQSAKEGVHGEVRSLEDKRRDVQRRLQEQQQLIRACEEQDQRQINSTLRCRDEIRAFQAALIKCDGRNENLEHVNDALFACEAKKTLLGCKPRPRPSQAERT